VAVTTPKPCPADTVVALNAMHFLSPRPEASATARRFLLMGTDSPVNIASWTCISNAGSCLVSARWHTADPNAAVVLACVALTRV
jgi:hypothetical protein